MSHLEDTLEHHLTAAKVPFTREVAAIPSRRFRVDFVIPPDLAVEVDGGGFVNGRHSRGTGIERDCEKSALLAIAGYRLMRVTGRQVESGQALKWIERAIAKGRAA